MQPKMSEFMRQHRFDFRRLDARQQRVEEYDALVAADAGEVGVAVRRAQRSVHHEHAAARRESAALEQRLDPLLERLVGERRESVEQRRDELRGRPGQPQGKASQISQTHPHHHAPARSMRVSVASNSGAPSSSGQQPLLGQIHRIQPRRDSIESEAGFDLERSPQRER